MRFKPRGKTKGKGKIRPYPPGRARPPRRRIVRSVEPIGLIPRSIQRTLGRFVTQLFQTTNVAVVEEFRISRYQILVSLQTLTFMIFVPWIANGLSVRYIGAPLTEHLWDGGSQTEIFLNRHFETTALQDLENFEAELYFDFMLRPKSYDTPIWASYLVDEPYPGVAQNALSRKTEDLANYYNQRSIDSLTTIFGDVVTGSTLVFVMLGLRAQLIISKSFLVEFIYSLSDTIKGVLLILGANLLVGFHSPRGWELLLETIMDRYGFPPNENFIFLFVGSFPVLLDTVFKYWIFRYLNKISPSTVATYHAMIE